MSANDPRFPQRRLNYGRGGAVGGAPTRSASRSGPSGAVRRLLHDLKDLYKDPIPGIAARPLENDIFTWHCNIWGTNKYEGVILHLTFKFPNDYPSSPPVVKLSTHVPHPNVDGFDICLDLLKTVGYDVQIPYQGWTTAYTIQSILLQLQAFLFDDNIPQGGCNLYYCCDWCCGAQQMWVQLKESYTINQATQSQISKARKHMESFECKDCTHSMKSPWPRSVCTESKTSELEDVIRKQLKKHKARSGTSCTYLQLDARPLSKRVNKLVRSYESSLSTTSVKTCFWDRLNEQVSCLIFEYLLFSDLQMIKGVCRFFHDIVNSYKIALRREIVCFHRKNGIVDDLVGVGIRADYYPDGNIKEIRAFLDPLCKSAFDIDHVRTSVWREAFTEWIPLLINSNHASRAFPVVEKQIAKLLKVREFRPAHALKIISCLMNSMVVQLMRNVKGDMEVLQDLDRRYAVVEEYTYDKFDRYKYELRDNLYHSEKALLGYYAFHHLLLGFCARYPEIQYLADKKVREFMNDPTKRTKRHTPNLGEFLINLTLSTQRWDDVAPAILNEVMTRNARWILQKFPELEGSVSTCVRLRRSFQGTVVSKRLLMFQTYFLGLVDAKNSHRTRSVKGLPNFRRRLDMYNRTLGRPSHQDIMRLQKACVTIMGCSEWHEYFLFIGVNPLQPTNLYDKLTEGMKNSKRLRYHHSRGRPNSNSLASKKTAGCLCPAGSVCLYFDTTKRLRKSIFEYRRFVRSNMPSPSPILGHENRHDLSKSPEIKDHVRKLVENGADPNWPLKYQREDGVVTWYSVIGNPELEKIVSDVLNTTQWKIFSDKVGTNSIQPAYTAPAPRKKKVVKQEDGWFTVSPGKASEGLAEQKEELAVKSSPGSSAASWSTATSVKSSQKPFSFPNQPDPTKPKQSGVVTSKNAFDLLHEDAQGVLPHATHESDSKGTQKTKKRNRRRKKKKAGGGDGGGENEASHEIQETCTCERCRVFFSEPKQEKRVIPPKPLTNQPKNKVTKPKGGRGSGMGNRPAPRQRPKPSQDVQLSRRLQRVDNKIKRSEESQQTSSLSLNEEKLLLQSLADLRAERRKLKREIRTEKVRQQEQRKEKLRLEKEEAEKEKLESPESDALGREESDKGLFNNDDFPSLC